MIALPRALRASVVGSAVASALLLGSACSTGHEPSGAAAPPPTPTSPPSSERTPVRAPLQVAVQASKITPGKPIELTIVIDRTSTGTPLFLEVVLPPGARAAKGRLSERIDDEGEHIERSIVLDIGSSTPAFDVKVTVDTGDQHFGAHATAAYRFGRPAPLLPQPARTGAPVIINGQDYGASIPLEPATR